MKLENLGIKLEEENGKFAYGGNLYLRNTNITNYPVIYNCGVEDRTIYLDFNDKNIICIGCFRGNKEKAIEAIEKKYKYNKEEMNKYIEKVNNCFKIWEDKENEQK
jgi:hypothetical protein